MTLAFKETAYSRVKELTYLFSPNALALLTDDISLYCKPGGLAIVKIIQRNLMEGEVTCSTLRYTTAHMELPLPSTNYCCPRRCMLRSS